MDHLLSKDNLGNSPAARGTPNPVLTHRGHGLRGDIGPDAAPKPPGPAGFPRGFISPQRSTKNGGPGLTRPGRPFSPPGRRAVPAPVDLDCGVAPRPAARETRDGSDAVLRPLFDNSVVRTNSSRELGGIVAIFKSSTNVDLLDPRPSGDGEQSTSPHGP